MVKIPITLNNVFKVLNITVKGGGTVLLSTATSCYLAVVIEKTAHRVQYHYFPHWYKDVDFALGLDLHKKLETQQENQDTTTHDVSSDAVIAQLIGEESGDDSYLDDLNVYMANNINDGYDRSRNDHLESCEESFESPSPSMLLPSINNNANSNTQDAKSSSSMRSFFNNESTSSVLHNCAMTA